MERDREILNAEQAELKAEQAETERDREILKAEQTEAKRNIERQKEKEKLRKEQEEAQRLKIKDRIYTRITHDFRTPLTNIKGATEQIKGNENSKILIHREIKYLLYLIDQILDNAKLESNVMKLQLVQDEIISFLRYATSPFQTQAIASNKVTTRI